MIRRLLNRLKEDYLLTNQNWQVRVVFFGVMAVTLIVYLVVVMTPAGGPEEERQTGLLKQLAAETQLYPGAKQMEERVRLKANWVSLWVKYETPDDFKKVNQFYHQQLTSKAWVKDQTQDATRGRNTYRKGPYEIALYPVESPKVGFQLIFRWDRP